MMGRVHSFTPLRPKSSGWLKMDEFVNESELEYYAVSM